MLKSSLTWSAVKALCMCGKPFTANGMKWHGDPAFYLREENMLQGFMVHGKKHFSVGCIDRCRHRVGLVVSEEMGSRGVNSVFVFSATTGVSELLFVEAERFDVGTFCRTITADSWEDHGFLRFVCSLVVAGLVALEFTSPFCDLSNEAASKAKSCWTASLLPPRYPRIQRQIKASRSLIKASLRA